MYRFRLYGASEREVLAKRLDQCLQNWSREWLGGVAKLSSSLATVDHFQPDDKVKWRGMSHHGATLAYSLSGEFSKRLALETGWCDSAVARKASSIWDETIWDCIDALARQILCPMAGESELSSASAATDLNDDSVWLMHGAGYVWYSIKLDQEWLAFILSPQVIDALLVSSSPTKTGALSSRLRAVSNGICKLELIAGVAEVSIGELHTLSPGHIIQLDKVIGQPFKLYTAEGREVSDGYLAACGNNKAVQLAK
ncbi:MAG: FliM/FliN family flagellar motor switch protein [Pseudomonadota bacterium]